MGLEDKGRDRYFRAGLSLSVCMRCSKKNNRKVTNAIGAAIAKYDVTNIFGERKTPASWPQHILLANMTASKTSPTGSADKTTGKSSNRSSEKTLMRQDILGARRLSNYFWAAVTAVGGLGFFLAGISSFLNTNLLPFSDLPAQLVFIPQGIAMGFYGTAALLLCLYLCLIVVWNVGSGYNEFDKAAGEARIVRRGFPGKNKVIELVYPLKDLLAVRAEIKEGLNPKRSLYLRVKGKGDLPLTRVGQPISLADLENQGADLARFLQVPLEGL